jgi:hypothetical protein
MMTTSTDPTYERYQVQVTCVKWILKDDGTWEWNGQLADVPPNAQGVRVFSVREGTWIGVHLLNRGVEVTVDLTINEGFEPGARTRQRVRNYADRLARRVEHEVPILCVQGDAIQVDVCTSMGRSLGMCLRFERVGK